jgi:hypothetical protein
MGLGADGTLAFFAGLVCITSALAVMTSRRFTVWMVSTRWNPRARLYVRIFGLERWVWFSRWVGAPIGAVVGIGLLLVGFKLIGNK